MAHTTHDGFGEVAIPHGHICHTPDAHRCHRRAAGRITHQVGTEEVESDGSDVVWHLSQPLRRLSRHQPSPPDNPLTLSPVLHLLRSAGYLGQKRSTRPEQTQGTGERCLRYQQLFYARVLLHPCPRPTKGLQHLQCTEEGVSGKCCSGLLQPSDYLYSHSALPLTSPSYLSGLLPSHLATRHCPRPDALETQTGCQMGLF
mmetsp:Transcript_28692/g.51487  ORF Transcript_28692/g.51487 Transcript_28692/m.51487 type:complete len:201 (+) Transcript_28692:895-1497(+)